MTKEGKTLTGEELEQAFQEGLNYLRDLGLRGTHKVVLESGKEGKMSVSHPKMGELRILIQFLTGREVYSIDLTEGLKEIHVPATEVIHTEVLGDLPPFPCGWIEFKTSGTLSSDYKEHIEGQKLLAVKVVDTIKAGIKQ